MCLMCEQEAMYQAYLDYLAQQAAEAKTTEGAGAPSSPANPFACDDGSSSESPPSVAPKVA